MIDDVELYKHYVDVIVRFTKKSDIIPLSIVWSDGREYKIDKVYTKQK